MTLIRAKAPPNPLAGWQVDPAHIRTIGRDLARPECILAERDGSLWTADSRGGVMHIRPDGSQRLITASGNRERARRPISSKARFRTASPSRAMATSSSPISAPTRWRS